MIVDYSLSGNNGEELTRSLSEEKLTEQQQQQEQEEEEEEVKGRP